MPSFCHDFHSTPPTRVSPAALHFCVVINVAGGFDVEDRRLWTLARECLDADDQRSELGGRIFIM